MVSVCFGQNAEVKSETESTYQNKVVLLTIGNDEIGSGDIIRNIIEIVEKGEECGVSGFVFELDGTKGKGAEVIKLIEKMGNSRVRIDAWVNGQATGVASWIALGADRIFMSPASLIGGGHPALQFDDKLSEAVQEVEMRRAILMNKARVLAVSNVKGHDENVVGALLDPDTEFVSNGEVISKKGDSLFLDAKTASEKLGLVDKIVQDQEGLKSVVDKEVVIAGNSYDFLKKLKMKEESKSIDKGSDDGKKGSALAIEAGSKDKDAEHEDNKLVSPTSTLKSKEESLKDKILVIPVGKNDLINSKRFRFMLRMLERANEEGAKAIVFDIDTPGGLAWDTNSLMAKLAKLKVPSYAFVNSRAISAGALISCATDGIYMSPGGSIGAAAVVTSGGSLGETERAKYDSAFSAMSRSVVRQKGYHVDIVQAMMVPAKEDIVADGEVLVSKGGILTLDSEQAILPYKGKTVLAKGIVDNIEELLAQEGIDGDQVRAKPLGFEKLAQWVTRISPILIMLGVFGAYTEMKAPGFGVAGAISLCAFSLFFFGHYVAGYLAGWEAVALVMLGLILIVLEFLILPGTLIFGLLGFILMIAGLIYTMAGLDFRMPGWSVEKVTFDTFKWPIMSVAISLIGSIIGIGFLMRFLPESKYMNGLVLGNEVGGGLAQADQPDVVASGVGYEGRNWVGKIGVANSELRPVGKADFSGIELEVLSNGEWIDKGASVKVIRQEGNEVLVEAV